MTDQPAAPPLAATDDQEPPIDLIGLSFPWGQLNARDVPSKGLVTRRDVILTLGMLAGMVAGVPTMVQLAPDGTLSVTPPQPPQGFLVSSGQFNLSTIGTQLVAAGAGGKTITVYALVLTMQRLAPRTSVLLTNLPNTKTIWSFAADVNGPQPLPLAALQLAAGDGLQLSSAGLLSCAGLISVIYKQV